MTEAAIDSRIGRDVFIALGESLGDDAWSVRIQVKPLIRFRASVATGAARPAAETN
jgi:cytochrome c-type biogenesis protein CcmF